MAGPSLPKKVLVRKTLGVRSLHGSDVVRTLPDSCDGFLFLRLWLRLCLILGEYLFGVDNYCYEISKKKTYHNVT